MSSASIPTELYERLPTPIAVAARHAALATRPEAIAERLLRVGDVSIRTLAALAIADYLGGPPDPEIDKAFRVLERPSLGQWVEAGRKAGSGVLRRNMPPFMPEAASLFTSNAQTINAFLAWRNKPSHARSGSHTMGMRSLAAGLRDAVCELLDALRWLEPFRLARLTEVHPVGGGVFAGHLHELSGYDEQPLPRAVHWREAVFVPARLYLLAPDLGAALALHPLLGLGPHPATGEYKVTVVESFPEGRSARILTVLGGEQVSDSEPLGEGADLAARLRAAGAGRRQALAHFVPLDPASPLARQLDVAAAPTPQVRPTPPPSRRPRRRLGAALGLAVVLAAAGGAASWWWHPPAPAGPPTVHVPAGPFRFGYPPGAPHGRFDAPEEVRDLPAFELHAREVTVADYAACVAAGACMPPTPTTEHCPERAMTWDRPGFEDHPVSCVTWTQARSYCQWLGMDLPTEQQWEKAARGTDGRRYPWGDEGPGTPGNARANVPETRADPKSRPGTKAAGSFPDGASPYGALDMLGNVAEWTLTGRDAGETGRAKVVRGASYGVGGDALSTWRRFHLHRDTSYVRAGFRCARRAP